MFLAGLTLFVFYYLPLNLTRIASPYIPPQYLPELRYIEQSISDSSLPLLGIFLAILTFVDTIIRGSWGYGVILVVMGSFWILYDLSLYKQGLLLSGIAPSTLSFLQGGHGQASSSSLLSSTMIADVLTGIIVLFILSSLITITRGVRILVRWHRKRTAGNLERERAQLSYRNRIS